MTATTAGGSSSTKLTQKLIALVAVTCAALLVRKAISGRSHDAAESVSLVADLTPATMHAPTERALSSAFLYVEERHQADEVPRQWGDHPGPASHGERFCDKPNTADCMILLDSGHTGCAPEPQSVEDQAAYFMQNWLAEYRNGRATDVLGPEVAFSSSLHGLRQTSAEDRHPSCGGRAVEHNMKAIAAEVGSSCVIFDVGANIGTYADWLLGNVPRQCRIFSYEPVPPTFATFKQRHKKHSRVTAFNKAVSDSVGMTTISFGKTGDRGAKLGGRADATNAAQVPVTTVDAEIGSLVEASNSIPFVKIDVESLELSVLRGMAASLRDRRIRTVLWERNAEQHECSCGQRDAEGRCSCTPANSMKDEVDFIASFGYHVYLPGIKYFLRLDGEYWHPNYEIGFYTHLGRRSPVINLLGVRPGDPILAYIAEKHTMFNPPGAFTF